MTRRNVFRWSVVLVWLGMTAWLLRYEAYPEYFTHYLDGYRHLLGGEVLVRDSWMRILFKGRPIGYSYTSLDTDESDPAAYYTIDTRVYLRMKLMGEDKRIHVTSSMALNMLYDVQTFSFSLAADSYNMTMTATRRQGRTFDVVTETPAGSDRRAVEIPDDVVLYSPMTEMALKKLRPGQQINIKTLDPASLTVATLTVRALRRETTDIGGAPVETTVLSTDYRGAAFLSWMEADGSVVRQETPFGWILERCTPMQALQTIKRAEGAEDILVGMSVRPDGIIRRPRQAESLKLRLSGVRFSREELEGPRQHVESIDGDTVILKVEAAVFPDAESAPGDAPADVTAHLAATPAVQSDHPEIRARAEAIVSGHAGSAGQAVAILEWVERSMVKEMTISLPSALDVLRTLRGDCNEHTYLFVALARAAGLPAKIVIGLAYHEGLFYYHAWPAVYLGRWVEMDPTWGQKGVDATHLALVEGEMAEQLQLVKVMGSLRIEILEEHPRD